MLMNPPLTEAVWSKSFFGKKTSKSAKENKFQALNNAVNCLATLPVPYFLKIFLAGQRLERWTLKDVKAGVNVNIMYPFW